MKKKLLRIAIVLAALVLIATLIGPSIVLSIVRQPESAAISFSLRDNSAIEIKIKGGKVNHKIVIK